MDDDDDDVGLCFFSYSHSALGVICVIRDAASRAGSERYRRRSIRRGVYAHSIGERAAL